MASWVRTITSPFRKGCIFFNQSKEKKHNQQGHPPPPPSLSMAEPGIFPFGGPLYRGKKILGENIWGFSKISGGHGPSSSAHDHHLRRHGHPRGMDLHDEVMACAYEDVRVMWSILDKSEPRVCNVSS